ncbi:hypothetical protein ACFV5N_02065 [Streptomyces sp. NPDC059853]|uniref:hypothetical protein n=1 Tax=Streptomyces sp. NPDC059853 TaxID=3346973 RepID=UPI0036576A11
MVNRVPAALLRHTVTVEPYIGDSAYGPRYGPPATVRALVYARPRIVRAADGRQLVASASVIAEPGLDCPPGSRITLPSGRTASALTVADHTAPGLPVPSCTEVMCD